MFGERTYSSHPTLLAVLCRLLDALPNLASVRLIDDFNNAIVSAFRAYSSFGNAPLYNIKSLDISHKALVAFMFTNLFPNIAVLRLQISARTVGLGCLRHLTKLKALSLDRDDSEECSGWCLGDIERLQRLIPAVQYLVLKGELEHTRVSVSLLYDLSYSSS